MPIPMGAAFARPLALMKAALSASSLSRTPPDCSSMTMCGTCPVPGRAPPPPTTTPVPGRAPPPPTTTPRPCLAFRKAPEQLVQAEALFELGPVQLPVVMLFKQRHELVFPDP